MSLPRFLLGPGGPEVSSLAYGCWRLAEDPAGTSPARVRAKLDACLEAGLTTFDHADIYGNYEGEALFGAALAEAPELRARLEIVTKCGIDNPRAAKPETRMKHYNATGAYVEAAVERSLRALRTEYVDVLLIHRPDWLTSAEETAAGLRAVMDRGWAKAVGVSNYSTHQYALLAKYLGHPPVTNQVELNLLRMEAIYDGVLDQCQAHGVHPQAWSPLGGGRLFTDGNAATVRLREALQRLAASYGATPEQVALAWVAALPSRPQLVIGTNQPERIRDAAKSAAVQLERQHWYELWEAAQGRQVP